MTSILDQPTCDTNSEYQVVDTNASRFANPFDTMQNDVLYKWISSNYITSTPGNKTICLECIQSSKGGFGNYHFMSSGDEFSRAIPAIEVIVSYDNRPWKDMDPSQKIQKVLVLSNEQDFEGLPRILEKPVNKITKMLTDTFRMGNYIFGRTIRFGICIYEESGFVKCYSFWSCPESIHNIDCCTEISTWLIYNYNSLTFFR